MSGQEEETCEFSYESFSSDPDEDEYERAIDSLREKINKYRFGEHGIQRTLASQAQRVLDAVEEAKPKVKAETVLQLTEIVTKTDQGITDPINTLGGYKHLTNEVIYRQRSVPKVIGGVVMLGCLGALSLAAGIALTVTGIGALTGAVVAMGGGGLGMLGLGIAIFKSSNKTNVNREITAFYNEMKQSRAQGANAECAASQPDSS